MKRNFLRLSGRHGFYRVLPSFTCVLVELIEFETEFSSSLQDRQFLLLELPSFYRVFTEFQPSACRVRHGFYRVLPGFQRILFELAEFSTGFL